eukprot:8454280-Alexandrium_andersonii.AAC.1
MCSGWTRGISGALRRRTRRAAVLSRGCLTSDGPGRRLPHIPWMASFARPGRALCEGLAPQSPAVFERHWCP